MTKRILLINDDGTATVGGVKVRVVPVEPTRDMRHKFHDANDAWEEGECDEKGYPLNAPDCQWKAMLSAAAIDLSGLPRVPEKRPLNERDGIDACNACWNDALDAIGVTK